MKKLGCSLLLAVGLAFSAPAWAQPDEATRTAARALGTSGVEAYQAGDYATATSQLEKAYGILRVPSLGLWSARALVQNGKWVEALERYREVESLQVPSGDYAVQKQAQADAQTDLQALRPRIPLLAVKTEGAPLAETEISIDGRTVPSNLAGEGRLVNPGKHVVDGRYAGKPLRVEVTLKEGQRETATLHFGAGEPVAALAASGAAANEEPKKDSGPPPDGRTMRTAGYVALSAGTVGVAVGTVFGIMALGKKSQLDNSCVDELCPPDQEEKVDAYNTRRTISSVGFIAGGVLAGLGIVLVVSAPPNRPRTEAYFTPNSAGLRGRF